MKDQLVITRIEPLTLLELRNGFAKVARLKVAQRQPLSSLGVSRIHLHGVGQLVDSRFGPRSQVIVDAEKYFRGLQPGVPP